MTTAQETRAAGFDERVLLRRLRTRNEAAFTELVTRYHGPLTRLAMTFVPSRAVADEVVQETWLGVIAGLDRFEGRSSLRTWIFRILVNRARTRGAKEARSVPFSALGDGELAVDPERFLAAGRPLAGHWALAPRAWAGDPEARLMSAEARTVIERAIAALPLAQRQVISLRDVEGWGAEEVCALLGVSDGNQRILLHRARSRVRATLDEYLAPTERAPRASRSRRAALGAG